MRLAVFLGYTSGLRQCLVIRAPASSRARDVAGASAAIDGMPTWRSEFRAAVAATDNGELGESVVQGIAAGISFIKQLETAKTIKLGWGTYAATSYIAY